MNILDIPNYRLSNQLLLKSNLTTPQEVVEHMCAMQAQDFPMSKWAVGVRLPGSTEKLITDALNKGLIIRTHLLRPTWHIVSSSDIYWVLQLSAPQIKAQNKARNKELELDELVLKKSRKIFEQALSGGKSLTREELIVKLKEAKIDTDQNRASHIFMEAEQEGLICSGIQTNSKVSYALLEERVPLKNLLKKDEALALLAKKYFTSRGPATLQDFVWWSGLRMADARLALELNSRNLESIVIESDIHYFTNQLKNNRSLSDVKTTVTSKIHALPAFDEYLIAYRNRNAVITIKDSKKAVSDNGIFRPFIVIDGLVKGIWKRTTKPNKIVIETNLFINLSKAEQKIIHTELMNYGKFLNSEVIFQTSE